MTTIGRTTGSRVIAPLQSVEAREAALLARYAMRSADTAGRKYAEPAHPYRGPFQRDRDRIVHSSAYRRLSGKTQVFTGEMGDYHRTRLTHTLEVASVARTLGRALALNEDLIEALALVHDLGHPPFGHAGEDVLNECLGAQGGFSHNRHALRIVEVLETRYHDFPGLNLSREVLEGQAARVDKSRAGLRPLLEAQVVEAADSVAYDTHDADDALELGLLSLGEVLSTSLWSQAARRLRTELTALSPGELRRAVLHELIDWQVSDLLHQAAQRLAEGTIDSPQAAREEELVVAPSKELAEQKAELESFLHERVYRHPLVLGERGRVQHRLRAMFEAFVGRPELLPAGFRGGVESAGPAVAAVDYLASLTDPFALREYERVFASTH